MFIVSKNGAILIGPTKPCKNPIKIYINENNIFQNTHNDEYLAIIRRAREYNIYFK